MNERLPMRILGPAMRAALMKANAEKLLASDSRVLNAVLILLPSYSRREDEAYVAQIAALANVGQSTTRRALKKLDALGIIGYKGRRGPGRKPLISLPDVAEQAAETAQHAEQSITAQHGEQSSGENRSPCRAPDCSPSRATTEESFREEGLDVVGLDEFDESESAELDRLLAATDFTPAQRVRAHKEPGRSIQWLLRSQEPDISNAVGYAWRGIEGENWPSAAKRTGTPSHSIDLPEAWQRFIAGIGWDESYDEGLVLDELRQRRRRFEGELTDSEALAAWREKRAERYPDREAA